jgi:putative MATE family efflux protein
VSKQATDPNGGVGPVHAEFEGESGPVEALPSASGPVRQTIFELAWPSITTNILQSIVGIVDMAIVGRVGVDAQAAVGSGHRIFFIGQAVMMAITAGTTALVARSWGANDRVEAERATHASLVFCCGLSLLLCAAGVGLAEPLAATFGLPASTTVQTAEFIRWLSAFHLGFTIQFVIGVALRAVGDVITPLLVGVVTNIMNVVLVYGLVFGELPGVPLPIEPMGVRGAAIASGLAFTLGSVIMLALYLAGRLRLQPRAAGSLTLDRLRRLWRIGYPTGLEQAVFQGGFYVFIVIVSQYGTAPNAAYNIGVQLLSLSFVIGFGYSIAASTLVGQHLGAGEPAQATQAGWHCMRLSIYSMIALGIVIVASAPWVAPFFNEDPEVVRLTVVFINVLGLVQPLMAIEFSLSGALRGAGDTRWPLISVMSGFLGVRLTLAVLFWQLGFSVEWVYAALIGDYIVKSIVLTLRFGRGRWQLLQV